MIKVRISTLKMILEILGGLFGLIIIGYFTITPILFVLSIWFESLHSITDILAQAGEYFFKYEMIFIFFFVLSLPLLLVLYLPFKFLVFVSKIFVDFVTDEEYEEFQELKRKMLKEYQEKLERKAQEKLNCKAQKAKAS